MFVNREREQFGVMLRTSSPEREGAFRPQKGRGVRKEPKLNLLVLIIA